MKYLNIAKAIEAWRAIQPLSERDRERLSRKFTVDFNYNSNHIEGNTLTYGQTELLLLFGKVVGEAEMKDLEEMKASNVGLKMMQEQALIKEMPLVGTISSRNYIFGDKMRLDIEKEGKRIVTWSDGVTEWTYDSSTNEIEITNAKPRSSEDDNMDMFESVTEGYDVSISEELNDKWILRCKKSRSNKDKDAPKRMDLIVAKDTYFPLSISAKNGLVSVTIRDLKYGITEEDVTFNPENYPTAKYIDKR